MWHYKSWAFSVCFVSLMESDMVLTDLHAGEQMTLLSIIAGGSLSLSPSLSLHLFQVHTI